MSSGYSRHATNIYIMCHKNTKVTQTNNDDNILKLESMIPHRIVQYMTIPEQTTTHLIVHYIITRHKSNTIFQYSLDLFKLNSHTTACNEATSPSSKHLDSPPLLLWHDKHAQASAPSPPYAHLPASFAVLLAAPFLLPPPGVSSPPSPAALLPTSCISPYTSCPPP